MAAVRCALCNQPFPVNDLMAVGSGVCPRCSRPCTTVSFPALFHGGNNPPPLSSDPLQEGEAACFYSPTRRATKECSHCGVLISEAWAAQWGSETVCLKCLEHLRQKGADTRFQSSRTLWDNIALLLSLLPFTFIFWWAAIFTAPAALFIAIRHWNTPRSIVPRGRARLVSAIILSSLQICGMAYFFAGLWFGWFK